MYSVVMRKYLGDGDEPAPACVTTDKGHLMRSFLRLRVGLVQLLIKYKKGGNK
jgi:hypothetical protein